MKTKCGNCQNCQLISSKKYYQHSIVCNNNSVSDADIIIVCDYESIGSNLVSFLDNDYKDWKYVIMNHYLCDKSGFDNIDNNQCINNCTGNVTSIKEKTHAKRCFVLGVKYDKLPNDFQYVDSIEDLKKALVKEEEAKQQIAEQKKHYSFKIPEKYYTDNYRLVDIQYIASQNKLIYIFRDKDNKKSYFEFPQFEKDFYWYEAVNTNKIIEDIDNLRLVTGKYRDRNRTKKCYGADVDITTLHSVDYFLNNEKEAPIVRQNVMFFDIETYQYCKGVFPNPDKAEYPIVAISFRTDDPSDITHVYLLKIGDEIDNKVDELIKNGNYPYITVFDNEKVMLSSFFSRLKSDSVDFLAGWNINGFDIPYIVNRMNKIGMKPIEFSPFGVCYADSKSGKNEIIGYVVMDQLKLFKELTYQVQPSYSLNFIAGVVLGKEKVQHVGKSIDDMYHSDIKLFMDYSQQDTQLIYEIDNEVKHIGLQDEIRRVATVSHKGASTTIGQAEGLYATQLKKNGEISRNYTHDVPEVKFPGAYVFDAQPGLHEGLLCDFDFTSLYPSLIRTFNIGPDSYIGKVDEDIARAYIFNKKSLKTKKFNIVIDPIHNTKVSSITLDIFEKFLNKYHAQITIIGTIFCGHDIKESINCNMLSMLMSSRKVYKKKMLEAKERNNEQQTIEYNAKQLAFKIIANSMYGVLGAIAWRFYNPNLGKSVTMSGQEMLKYSATRVRDYMDGIIDENHHDIDIGFEAKAVSDHDHIIYGDTDSLMIQLTNYLQKKGIKVEKSKAAQNEIDKIQTFINEIAIPQLLTYHHLNLKYSVMNLKNEFMFSRYYSLEGKKHYASKVISQEGHDVSYIDIKGLEIKRSEIPPLSQSMLKEFIDTIMDESIKKIDLISKLNAISDKYYKLISNSLNERNNDAARIGSFSHELQDYKVLPQHVKGMLIWNDLAGKEDFKTGTKGRLWNILGVDIDKMPSNIKDNYHNILMKHFQTKDLKCVCVPEDVEKLPDYFIVDTKKMLEYAWQDRKDNLLNPLYIESESELLF